MCIEGPFDTMEGSTVYILECIILIIAQNWTESSFTALHNITEIASSDTLYRPMCV